MRGKCIQPPGRWKMLSVHIGQQVLLQRRSFHLEFDYFRHRGHRTGLMISLVSGLQPPFLHWQKCRTNSGVSDSRDAAEAVCLDQVTLLDDVGAWVGSIFPVTSPSTEIGEGQNKATLLMCEGNCCGAATAGGCRCCHGGAEGV